MQSDENTNTASGCQSILETRAHKVVLIFSLIAACVCVCTRERENGWLRVPACQNTAQVITPWKPISGRHKCIRLCKPKLSTCFAPFLPAQSTFYIKKKKKAVVFHFHMKTPSFCHDQSMMPHVYSTYHGCVNCQYEHGRQEVKSSAWQPGTQTSELTQCVGFSLC